MEWYYNADVTTCCVTRVVKWGELKNFILGIAIVIGLILITIAMIYSNVVIKTKTKKKLSDLSEMIKQYMSEEDQSIELFTVEYSEISTQLAELKMKLQKHEQLLKEEVSRKKIL